MVKEKHDQMDLFESALPMGQVVLSPVLQEIDELLENTPEIIQEVKSIFEKRWPNSKNSGRASQPVHVIIRLLILKHLKNWRLRETIKEVEYNLEYRKFTKLYLEKVPHYSILSRYENLIPEETLHRINDLLVNAAKGKGISKGNKLRIDTTVVQSNIHYPTDSSLMTDGTRVINRVIKKAKKAGLIIGKLAQDTTRQAKRRLLEIVKYAPKRSEENSALVKKSYRRLITLTKRMTKRANKIKGILIKSKTRDIKTQALIFHLVEQIDRFVPRIKKVIYQATKRVLKGTQVASHEKILSLFQPLSYVIRKGKLRRPTEFGQIVKIQEADGKIITDFKVLPTNSGDRELLMPSVEKHKKLFDRPPRLVAGDRNFYSEDLEEKLRAAGIKRIGIMKIGKKNSDRRNLERMPWFRQSQKFRAGCEGSISVLKRAFGMDRSLNKREDGFGSWVGWRVITRNLVTIAQTT
jgi:transposase, IS5 family